MTAFSTLEALSFLQVFLLLSVAKVVYMINIHSIWISSGGGVESGGSLMGFLMVVVPRSVGHENLVSILNSDHLFDYAVKISRNISGVAELVEDSWF
jgi:hypothetical protein